MKTISIYTDGGCSGNPGPGAWAYAIQSGGTLISDSGAERGTTNNRMELMAVIRALENDSSRKHDQGITVFTDSLYVKKGITEWIKRWQTNGWQNVARQPVKNRDLWQRLLSIADGLDIDWQWVRGHSGDRLNEMCDKLVRSEIKKLAAKSG